MKELKITDQTVKRLAELANLNLSEGREPLIAAQLAEWIQNANKLSGKMSEPVHQSLLPITVINQK